MTTTEKQELIHIYRKEIERLQQEISARTTSTGLFNFNNQERIR